MLEMLKVKLKFSRNLLTLVTGLKYEQKLKNKVITEQQAIYRRKLL